MPRRCLMSFWFSSQLHERKISPLKVFSVSLFLHHLGSPQWDADRMLLHYNPGHSSQCSQKSLIHFWGVAWLCRAHYILCLILKDISQKTYFSIVTIINYVQRKWMSTLKGWTFPIPAFKAAQQSLSVRTNKYAFILTTQFLKIERSRPAPG